MPVYNNKKKTYSKEIQNALMSILRDCEMEDDYTRQTVLKEAKQNELYWHGFQYIFWDESLHDYRIPTQTLLEDVSTREDTKYIYDYVVNIFKAHGLSIIAALSAEIPNVAMSPEDADNPDDVRAAKRAEILGKIICKKNKSKLVFFQALFTLFTNQFCAAYNCYERDKEFGTIKIPKYKMEKVQTTPDTYTCKDCGWKTETNFQKCEECSGELAKEEGQFEDLKIPDGFEEGELGEEHIKIRGSLNVKLPVYAADQKACGYLIEYSDQHYAYLRSIYKDVDRNKIKRGATDDYERIARSFSIGRVYSDTYLQNLLTLKRIWIRPWMFDTQEEDVAALLYKEFPDGVRLDAIEDSFAAAEKEKLDDHWTITKGDPSRSIHGDPICKSIVPMQDLENNVMNLLIESLEHSIPSTFADPDILDFDLYSKQEVSPGAVYPSKAPINSLKRMDDYFFTLKASSVPAEGVTFDKIIGDKSQFLSGSFPSIFGGPQQEGSKTLGEYQESRNFALQRLSIPYQYLYFWWADVVYKAIKEHVKNMIDDETYVQKESSGRFENVTFLKEDFQNGKFSTLIPESSIELPVSYSQKKSLIREMIASNNEYLIQFLFSSENRNATMKFLGIEEFSDLDANQTSKQLREITQLLNSEPLNENISSVPVEPEIDDNLIHVRVIRTFASSDVGQQYKVLNPVGYKNMLLHAREHLLLERDLMSLNESSSSEDNKNVNNKKEEVNA